MGFSEASGWPWWKQDAGLMPEGSSCRLMFLLEVIIKVWESKSIAMNQKVVPSGFMLKERERCY